MINKFLVTVGMFRNIFSSIVFFITDILGGGKIMIIGNLIKNQFLTARNWPFGAAISIFLIIMTLLLVRVYKGLGGKMDDLGGGM
jgi:spermidine/putrescine transport system permease protein